MPRLENLWQRAKAKRFEWSAQIDSAQRSGKLNRTRRPRRDQVPQEGIVDYPVSAKTRRAHRAKAQKSASTRDYLKLSLIQAMDRRNFYRRISRAVRGHLRGLACRPALSARRDKALGKKSSVSWRVLQIKKRRQASCRHLIYPVPDPKFPF